MKNALTKKDWVLLALDAAALDRLRVMKALFLVWLHYNRNIHDYFEFVPYLYGPCSFEVYSILSDLQRDKLAVQAPESPLAWAPYYLTQRGKEEATEAKKRAKPDEQEAIRKWAQFAESTDFHNLLRHVYTQAPDFAVNSLVRNIVSAH